MAKTKDLKITDQELKQIQEKVQLINQVQMQIGGLELQKTTMIGQINVLQKDLNDLQVVLEEKYGKVSVNLQDGTIREIPQEDEADKKD